MKRGIRTTEFWWGVMLSGGIWWLVYSGQYPAHGSPGYEGIQYLIMLWGAYTGYRGFTKQKTNGTPETQNPPTP